MIFKNGRVLPEVVDLVVRPRRVPRERVGPVIKATQSPLWRARSQKQMLLLGGAPLRILCRRYPYRRKTRLRVSLKVLPETEVTGASFAD